MMIIVFFALYIAQHIGILKRIKFLAKEEETPKGELGSSFQRQSWGFGRDGGGNRERIRERKKKDGNKT